MNQKYEPDIADQQRIVIALGVVATEIAVLALADSHRLVSGIIGGLFFLPAVFSFLFIILTGAHLKFSHAGDIGELAVPHKLRHWSYDMSISAYWGALLVSMIAFGAFLFGWNGKSNTLFSYWPSFFVSTGFLSVLVLIASIVSNKESKQKKR